MSTIYHPTTNRQTERTNQSLEQYLRHYVNNIQNNWVLLLSIAQLALNTKISDITKITSFFANYGKEPNLFGRERNYLEAQSAIEKIATLKKIHKNILFMQSRSAKYQNKKQKTTSQLKRGDKIYLLTKNLKTRKKSKKLNKIKIGPFFIKAVKRSVNYKLDLSKNARVFSVFHILLLESVDLSTSIQKTFYYKAQEESKYKVEQILKQQSQKYLVK